jgi:hypothetical protein
MLNKPSWQLINIGGVESSQLPLLGQLLSEGFLFCVCCKGEHSGTITLATRNFAAGRGVHDNCGTMVIWLPWMLPVVDAASSAEA